MTRWLFHQSSSSLSLVSRLNSSRSSTSAGEDGLCSTEPPSLQHHSTIFFQCVETCTTCKHSYLTIKCSMFVCANTRYKNAFWNSIFVLWPKGNILHFQDMLNNLSFICQKNAVYFIFLSSNVPKQYSPFLQTTCQFEYQSNHLKVTVWQLQATDNKYLHCYNIQLIVAIQ